MGLTTCISTAKEELNAATTKLQSGNHAEGALYLTNLFNTLEDCIKRAKLLGDEKEELIMRADILELLFNGLTLAAQFINKEEFNEFLQSEELKVSKIKKSFENSQEPRPEGTGLGMVVLMQVLTRLSFNNKMLLELPVSGYKNVGMHTLVPTASVEPLNTTFTKSLWNMPDMACRRVLNSYTGGLYHVAV
ncbi:MAG: hypothetical protein KAI34_06765 [Candidatus Lokiarchaeota archaeon]|nr:hypothetical protein [Candidatus Lokiarchaeota archaeon]